MIILGNISLTITGPREQLNQITGYLDASFVYGSTAAENEALRDTSQSSMYYSEIKSTKIFLLMKFYKC